MLVENSAEGRTSAYRGALISADTETFVYKQPSVGPMHIR